ncbi:Protein lifeguard 1 [Armadillidium nasatum]|uniref:Protein lifeguard 1 n=1 Tax=Armadillidium nasatum TaxID=96803 RepID=A0A5N5T8N6_9CRUS|nr:Protein lifeguard 1 [Armadillidium nasatum]
MLAGNCHQQFSQIILHTQLTQFSLDIPVGYGGPPQPVPYAIPIGTDGNVHGAVYNSNMRNSPSDVESNKPDALPDNFGSSFTSRSIRHTFVRKVYTILTFQLLVTLTVVAVFSLHEGVQSFVQEHAWICYLSYGVFIVTYFTLICCTGARRKWPGNMILLSIFTLSMAYLLGTISSFHKTEIVLFSVGITAAICFLITMFAIQTKIDFTGWGIYLFVASCILLIFGLIAIFMRNSTMNLVYSGGIVLLFSMYLIFDTQRIVGGRKHELSAEEHITGALVLYIDIVNIFLGILGLSRSY